MSDQGAENPESAGLDDGERMAPPAGPKNLVRNVMLATVLGVLVFAGLSAYGDVQRLRESMDHYRWSAFAWGTTLATANYALRYARWELYLRVLGIRGVPLLSSARIFVSGFIMSVTPGKVGEVFKSLLLFERHDIAFERTAPIVVAERLTDLLALVLLTAMGSLAFPQGWPIAIGGATLVAVVLAGCVWRPLGELGLTVAAKLPVIGKVAPKLRDAYEALRSLVGPAPLVFATAIAVVSWGLECVALQVIAEGFAGVTIDLYTATFSYGAPTIVGAVALLPGGLGVTEAGMAGMLEELAGFGAAEATATTMLTRLATLWWAVVLGVVALGLHRLAAPRAEK